MACQYDLASSDHPESAISSSLVSAQTPRADDATNPSATGNSADDGASFSSAGPTYEGFIRRMIGVYGAHVESLKCSSSALPGAH